MMQRYVILRELQNLLSFFNEKACSAEGGDEHNRAKNQKTYYIIIYYK